MTMGYRSVNASHSKYPHVFAVIRVDEFASPDVDIEQRVTVTKVVGSVEEAAAEVDRLNALREKAGGRSKYFWQITRLVSSVEALRCFK